MIRLLENPKLRNDLDCNDLVIKNPGDMTPVPGGLVGIDDPRLSDPRPVIDGTVTNETVSATAGIEQSKLALNGNIPTAWLGASENQAARGDLYQPISGRNVAGGYPSLDVGKKVVIGQLPFTGPATGTVTELNMQAPPELAVSGSPITNGSGTFTVTWQSAADKTWLGINGPVGLELQVRAAFQSSLIPDELLPSDIPASWFTSGVFPLERLPLAVEMGVDHARGLLPDPGGPEEPSADFSDYLGRDMAWRTMILAIPYQPTLPNVQVTFLGYENNNAVVRLFCPQKNSRLFYLVLDPNALPVLIPPFEQTANPTTLKFAPGLMVQAYAAKAGWNNSVMANYSPPNPTDM